MKKRIQMRVLPLLLLLSIGHASFAEAWIRINQLGYLPHSTKIAVLINENDEKIYKFSIHDALTNEVVANRYSIEQRGAFYQFKSSYRLNFSSFTTPGAYYIKVGNYTSPTFRIDKEVYNGTADFLLNYMRQQRCGDNPCLNQSCHLYDGYKTTGKQGEKPSSKKIDAFGGWHDASDYLQYTTTSANAIYQLLFAYQQNPEVFSDIYGKDGRPGANGIPDILDEAKWGLDWLCRMNPDTNRYYNQIADDRDHASFRLPSEDAVNYGWGDGKGRPVYLITGEPQGLMGKMNRTNGKASTIAKFASSFALGAQLLKVHYPDFADDLFKRAEAAYNYAKQHPGVSQTAPCKSPYFYEEDNWADDMELAASTLYQITRENKYLTDATGYARMEPFTPWMGSDTANHYQWYPFVNLAHFNLISSTPPAVSAEITMNTRMALERLQFKGKSNPFTVGVPFIWCSNNLIVGAITHCKLYALRTGDNSFEEMEASLFDWLFGCNPWGTSMIVGLPQYSDSPSDPHSALWTNHQIQTYGGLVDGPVKGAIYNNLIGIKLTKPDTYAKFQTPMAVYHDDWGDYSTNEPTMDGTASLAFYLSCKENESGSKQTNNTYHHGAITRLDASRKVIALAFTGHEYNDGFKAINSALDKHKVKASFFFTGDFYRNKNNEKIINTLIFNKHYLGAHSDAHLLYCDWNDSNKTLVTQQEFAHDVAMNYEAMKKFSLTRAKATIFMAPYEWYNDTIATWSKQLGLTLVNFTPGTRTNGDYTIPNSNGPYYSSENILNTVMEIEAKEGLNGHIMLMHIGTDPKRTDKLYDHLDYLISTLISKGYQFVTLPDGI